MWRRRRWTEEMRPPPPGEPAPAPRAQPRPPRAVGGAVRLSSARSPRLEAFDSVLGEWRRGGCSREQAAGVLPEGMVPAWEGERTLL